MKELKGQMSVEDLGEWMAYQRIKPFGYDTQNRQIGTILQAIYNSAGKSFKKEFSCDDFFLKSYETPEDKMDKKEDQTTNFVDFLVGMVADQAKET